MTRTIRHRATCAALVALTLVSAVACFQWGPSDMSGLQADGATPTGYYAVVRDPDGTHIERCTYNVDPGCFQQDGSGGFRIAYDAVGPNNVNDSQGRERAWNDIAGNAACNATDGNGQPGYGWPGYGGFTPSTTACLDAVIAEIHDDPNDSEDNYSSACESGTPGDGSCTIDATRTAWLQHFFDVSTLGQTTARANAQDWVWAMRDFYLVIITDPSISGNQATGHPACVQMADNPTSGAKIKLGRWCF